MLLLAIGAPRKTDWADRLGMTPAGGVGANTAFKDAALLGRLLKEGGGWAESVAKRYEQDMRVYASDNVRMSFEVAAKQFNIVELK